MCAGSVGQRLALAYRRFLEALGHGRLVELFAVEEARLDRLALLAWPAVLDRAGKQHLAARLLADVGRRVLGEDARQVGAEQVDLRAREEPREDEGRLAAL